jgi:hypothetical protein
MLGRDFFVFEFIEIRQKAPALTAEFFRLLVGISAFRAEHIIYRLSVINQFTAEAQR